MEQLSDLDDEARRHMFRHVSPAWAADAHAS